MAEVAPTARLCKVVAEWSEMRPSWYSRVRGIDISPMPTSFFVVGGTGFPFGAHALMAASGRCVVSFARRGT